MNKLLKSYLVLLLFVATTISKSYAQCPNTNTYSGIDMGTPPCGTFDYASIATGEYILVDVVFGVRYQFSLCGASFDTELTGYPDAGGPFLFYNDDTGPLCPGGSSSVDWSATFTGKLRLFVHKFSCNSDGTPVDIGVSIVNIINFSSPTSNGSTINRCLSSSNLTLNATPLSGTFSGNGVTGNQFSPSVAGIGLHEIIYQSESCTQSIFINVVQDLSVGNITGGSDVCAGGDPDEMTVTPTGGSGIYTYQWFQEDGANCPLLSGTAIPTTNDPMYNPPAGLMNTRTYRVRVISSSAGGCSAILFSDNCITVNVNPYPPTPIITGNSSFCSGGSTILSAPAGYTYLWSTGETTETISVTTSGDYTVTIDDGTGCTATSNPFTVTVSAPTVYITHPIQPLICPNDITLTPTNSSDNYLWSPNGETTQSITISSPETFTVTITNSDGCLIAVEEFEIAAVAVPVIFHPVQTVCSGSILTPTNSSNGYIWSPNGETTQSIAVSSSGTYLVTLLDANGCPVSSERFPVTVRPVINANINVNFCDAVTTITLTGGSPEVIGDNYIVTNNGNGTFNGLPITHGQSFSVTDLTSGDWIDFDVEDSYGCSYHFEQAVLVDVSAPIVVCPGPQPQIPLTGCVGIMPDYTGLIVASDACNFTITQVAPIPGSTFPPGSMGNVLFSVIDEMGNASVCSFLFNVANDTQNPTAICQDITLPLNSFGTTSFTANDINNGSTDNCGLNIISMYHPGTFDCSDIGDHLVELYIVDAAGNSSSCQSTVTVIDPNIPTVSVGSDTTICYGESITLNGSFGGTATAVFWTTTGDGTFDDASLPNATYTHGLNDYLTPPILTYSSNNSPCTNASASLTLTITAVQVSSIGGTNPTCAGNDGSINILLNEPNVAHTVSFDIDGIPTSVIVTTDAVGLAVISGLSPGYYSNFSLIGQNDCPNYNDISWFDVTLSLPSDIHLYVSNTNPSICNANDGTLVISGLSPNTTYSDLSYFDGTSNITINSFTSDGAGIFIISNIGGGTYSNFTLDIAGCSVIFDNTPIDVINPILPAPFINYFPTPLCDNDIVTLNATPYSSSSITWYNASDLSTPIATGITYSPTLAVGVNSYCITNSINGCESDPFCLDVDASAYPNPPLMIDTTLCEGTAIALPGISSSGGVVHFYDDASLSNFLGSSYLILSNTMTGSHTFYATEEVASCISAPVEFTVTFTNCVPPCVTPILTTGPIECNSSTNTYTVYYYTYASTISTSVGTINNQGSFPFSISDIPFGTDVTITAGNGVGCEISQTIAAVNSCPTNCIDPQLSVGQGVCEGTGEYSIVFTETTGASITTNIGTIVGNLVTNIPVGTPVTLTATNGSCITSTTVQSPIDCNDPCTTFPISFSNGVCATDGSPFYSINFTAAPGAIITTNHGIVSGNQITNIPSGTFVSVIILIPGCDTVSVRAISPPDCPSCTSPSLTMGPITCNPTNNTYGISYFTSAGANVTTNTGNIIGNNIVNVPFGTNLIITSSSGPGCETVQTVTGLTSCPIDCVYPNLTTGQAVCQGTGGYSMSFSETTGAIISASTGTIVGNTIINIPIGTNLIITATNGTCSMNSVIESPEQCSDPCNNDPILSIGSISCNDINSTYSVFYGTSASTLSVSAGTITPFAIIDIPFGTDLIITASNGPGCETTQTITALTSCPVSCNYPNLEVQQGICEGTNFYTVNFLETSGAMISTSIGTIAGNSVINIPFGSPVTITATDGACMVSYTVESPTDCYDPCDNPAISLGGPVCATDGSATYSIDYVLSPGISGGNINAGTYTPTSIINIPSGLDLIINLTIAGCNTTQTIVPAPTCPECSNPTLTTGPAICNATNNTYSVSFNSDATSVTANAGTISGNSVIDIPFGTDVTITASNGTGCEVNQTIVALTSCPTDCVFPNLTVGQGVCDGTNFYSVAFSSDAIVNTASVGTIAGNTVINIPIGTPITITATNGTCITSTTVQSPADCNDPCANAPISVAGAVCATDGSAFYTVNYAAQTGTIITASSGTVTANSVINIPAGTDITITAVFTGCNTTTIDVAAPTCPECTTPTLSTGPVACDSITNTYSVQFNSNATNVSTSSGTIIGNIVTGIPFGVDVTITASNGSGCEVSQTIDALTGCPTDCVYPDLIVGQGVCDGTNFYSVAFTSNGMNTTTSAGTIIGNSVTNIPIGTSVTITAENGACITSTTVQSPANCDDPCSNAPISVAGAICATDGSAFYSVSFVTQPGTIVEANQGTATPNAIVGIPSGVDVTIIAFFTGCDTTTIDVAAPTDCPQCTSPTLTTGPAICNATNNTYSVSFNSDATSVTTNVGTMSGSTVIDIPFGTDVTITASNGAGCEVSQIITALTSCPTDCVFPTLTVGQGVCQGTNTYSVAFSSDGVITTISVGSMVGNTVINIPIGIPITITSQNGACVTSITVLSPDNCDDPCGNAPISVAGAVCAADGSEFYAVSYNAQPGAIVITTAGIVTPNAIVNIPSGVDITITAVFTGCDVTTIDIVAPICPECTSPEAPIVTGGGVYCLDDVANLFSNVENVRWYTDIDLTNSIGSGFSVTPLPILGITTYYVATIDGECFSEPTEVTITLFECEDFEIPTAFTPNSDGVNDYWEIPGLHELYPKNIVRIYNRWGNLLFESDGYETPWDGRYNGEDLPVASYYFIIELNDGVNESLTGTVTIVKKDK